MKMTTFNGRRVDPWNLTADDLQIDNIAHALSMLCRFGGHSREFYSVAQHCVRVARSLPPELWLEGLMHDATEAFLGDMVRPVKHKLEEYKKLEDRVWQVFAFKYGLNNPLHPSVKYADNACLKAELIQFVTNSQDELSNPFWNQFVAFPRVDRAWNPAESKALFLITFTEALAKKIELAQGQSFKVH